ncbi:MAG: TonB-dependent receptor [Bacteroidia bacterium]
MNNCFRAWLFFVAILLTGTLQAQENPLVSGRFEGVLFSEFVNAIEQQTHFHFYYDESVPDSFRVSGDFKETPLTEVLTYVFQSTPLKYALYHGDVFITPNAAIHTSISSSYLGAEPVPNNEEETDLSILEFIQSLDDLSNQQQKQVLTIGKSSQVTAGGKATLSGKIKNVFTGESIIGATILHEASRTGAMSDALGNYEITIPTGRVQLTVSSMGMLPAVRELLIYGDGELDIELKEEVTTLKEVVIEAERGGNVTKTQMGQEKMDIKSIKQLPSLLGEVDVLKAILTLPGVQSSGENATGLNVRGGSTGQNLILFNQAPIYNSAHLFGVFSVFNPEVIKEVELYKSGVPAKYGGRISSVLEVNSKDGNKKQMTGSGGIGLVSGRLLLEGPIVKEKLSFLVSGRSTYSDWLLSRIPNEEINSSRASFYDIHTRFTYEKDKKNSFSVSSYFSEDQFSFRNDTAYQYSNFNTMAKWKRIFSEKLFGEFTGGFSQYKYRISYDGVPVNAFESRYKINQSIGKADFHYYLKNHTFSFGLNGDFYRLSPVSVSPLGPASLVAENAIADEQALETAVYLGDQIKLGNRLSLYGAIRYSFFHNLGPGLVNQYAPNLPMTQDNITGTQSYGKNELIKFYHGPEFRASGRFLLNGSTSVKLSYQRMRQYIHMLSNTISISPTDIWKLSDYHILPEVGDQFSFGLFRNLKSNTIETSAEVYYKTTDNFLDYRDGAQLFLNRNIETDIIATSGTAYGVELMIRKVTGKFNGWLAYTYSRSLLQTEAVSGRESINFGRKYPSSFDKPHDITLVSNYKFSRRFSFSFNFTYSTGRPVTLPLGKYDLYEAERLFFSGRNQYRIPDYYRADVSLNFEGNHKVKKILHSSWSVAVYNITGRDNAYSVFYRTEGGYVRGYQLSIFGEPIPTITYNFRF